MSDIDDHPPDDDDIDDEEIDDDEEKDDEEEIEDEEIDIKKTTFEYKVISTENRRTNNMISLYELTNVIGTRAQMIDSTTNESIYVSLKGLENSIAIAETEIRQNKCPLTIERLIYRDSHVCKVEQWTVNELIKPDIFTST